MSTTLKAAKREHAPLPVRERVLEAAMRVTAREGIVAASLDAVAREAGVSKGGLIHHFRTKDDLIAAMLEHFRTRVTRTLEERMASDPKPQGRFFRALIAMVFPPATSPADAAAPCEMSRLLMAVLTAAANNSPDSLAPFRRTMCVFRERLLAEGPNGLRQAALWPAIYGLLLWQHVGVISADDPLRQQLIDEWLKLAEGPGRDP